MQNAMKTRGKSEFYQDASQIIAGICKTKSKSGLINFAHDITYGQNQITMLTKDLALVDIYEKNKIPTLCTDESGRTLANGIYINKILEQQDKGCAVLMPLLLKISKQHQHNYGRNSLHFVQREKDCQHLYSLFFDLSEDEFLYWIINNGQFLHDFIDEYKVRMRDLLSVAKQNENKLELPNFQSAFHSKELDGPTPATIVHHTLNTPLHLSIQQCRCLVFLLRGNTAKQIASEMRLSYRTIEGYIENLRQILNCTSSKQLIITYGSQLPLLERQLKTTSINTTLQIKHKLLPSS